jgi:CheY-like chemotaxis protein
VSTILCVDDQPAGLVVRKQLLESKGYQVFTAVDGQHAISLSREHSIDLVVLDYRMPGMNGEELAAVLKTDNPARPIVLLTGYPGEIPRRLVASVDGFVEKGNGASVLLLAIEKAMHPAKPPQRATLDRERERA